MSNVGGSSGSGGSRGGKQNEMAKRPRSGSFAARFVTVEKYKNYEEHYAKTSVIHERGLDKDRVAPAFWDALGRRGWGDLRYLWGDFINESWAREFCANINEVDLEKKVVQVRGIPVPFSPEVINTVYGFAPHLARDYEAIILEMDAAGVDWREEVRQVLCPTTPWILAKDRTKIGLPVKAFSEDHRVVVRFMHSRLSPKDSPNRLSTDDLGLFYALHKGLPVDLGRLQFRVLENHAYEKARCVVLPHLITRLCKDSGVPECDGDVKVKIKKPIQRGTAQPAAHQPAQLQITDMERRILSQNDSIRGFLQHQQGRQEDIMSAFRAIHGPRPEFEAREMQYQFSPEIEAMMAQVRLEAPPSP